MVQRLHRVIFAHPVSVYAGYQLKDTISGTNSDFIVERTDMHPFDIYIRHKTNKTARAVTTIFNLVGREFEDFDVTILETAAEQPDAQSPATEPSAKETSAKPAPQNKR